MQALDRGPLALAIVNRLSGQALFLLASELEEVLSQNLDSAKKLAERIAELDGAVTEDPAALAARWSARVRVARLLRPRLDPFGRA